MLVSDNLCSDFSRIHAGKDNFAESNATRITNLNPCFYPPLQPDFPIIDECYYLILKRNRRRANFLGNDALNNMTANRLKLGREARMNLALVDFSVLGGLDFHQIFH